MKQWLDKLRPSHVRWHSLNFRVFHNALLSHFRGPKIFLCAVDLNSGYELVFSEKMLVRLDREGVQKLWKGYETDAFLSLGMGKDIPVATAVAASSAYPPYFSSVPVIVKGELRANCIDGGVIDNHAIIIARQMAKCVVNPEAYTGGWIFSNTIGRVLALDASAPVRIYRRYFWSRLSSLLRVVDILQHRQFQNMTEDLGDFKRMYNVQGEGIQLSMPVYNEDFALNSREITRLAARVRTHFDPFSNVECAVLAYLGYYWANQWAVDDDFGRKPPFPNNKPMRGIADILPAGFAPKAAMLTEPAIVEMFRPWRRLRRILARIDFRAPRIMPAH